MKNPDGEGKGNLDVGGEDEETLMMQMKKPLCLR